MDPWLPRGALRLLQQHDERHWRAGGGHHHSGGEAPPPTRRVISEQFGVHTQSVKHDKLEELIVVTVVIEALALALLSLSNTGFITSFYESPDLLHSLGSLAAVLQCSGRKL